MKFFKKKSDKKSDTAEQLEVPAAEQSAEQKESMVQRTRIVNNLAIEPYWDKRLDKLQEQIDGGLWEARALGGTEDVNDTSRIELVDKAESTFIELRCAVVNTQDAPGVIRESERQLERLKQSTRSRHYPRAVLGMIQSAIFEQDIGFKRIGETVFNFDENVVDVDYRRALERAHLLRSREGERRDVEVKKAR